MLWRLVMCACEPTSRSEQCFLRSLLRHLDVRAMMSFFIRSCHSVSIDGPFSASEHLRQPGLVISPIIGIRAYLHRI